MQIRQLINGQLVAGAGNLIPVMNPWSASTRFFG